VAGGGLPAITWGPAVVLAGLAALLVMVLIAGGIANAIDPEIETLGARLALQAALAISLIAVAVGAARMADGTIAAGEALGLRRPLRSPWGPAVVAYVLYIACAIAIAVAIEPEQEDITRELGFGEGGLGDVVAGLLIIGVAPVSEEIFFRSFFFGGLRSRMPFAAAAVIAAAIWGLFHYTGPDSWGVVLQLGVFGVVLSWLYERTGSIWPPIAVHAVNNAIAFSILTS
jgi:membrane protease YdiL (CAAX protease family)